MPYTPIDRYLATWRFEVAARHIRQGSRVCDVGCGVDARLLTFLSERIGSGVGIDELARPASFDHITIIRADITHPLPVTTGEFDHVTMLAVLEHLPRPESVLAECHRLLKSGGSLVMTWPGAIVDPLLMMLTRLGLVSREMSAEQHQPRIPLSKLKEMLRQIGFSSVEHGTFQLGVNNWLAARKD